MEVGDSTTIDSHMHINSIISKNNSKFYSGIGIHPLYTKLQDADSLYILAEDDKVVATGEMGLDSSKNNFNEQKNIR